ncbi:MAG: S8 family serine peptidase [Clostridia bacterium]
MNKFDTRLVGALNVVEETEALVRVSNPLQFSVLERNFKITHRYPFISSVGIMCGLNDAIKLERMREVEYVSAQSLVSAFDFGDEKKDIKKQTYGATKNTYDERNAEIKRENDTKNTSKQTENGFTEEKTNGFTESTTQNDLHKQKIEESRLGEIFANTNLTGEGVTLCVMDTGLSVHSDLEIPKKRIVHFVDLINGEEEPYDDNGHGTFVGGVAVGNGVLSGGKICGVARKANLIGLKVLGAEGETGTFKILDGMQWLFDNGRKYGIKVVCMSFGADPVPYADPLKLGVEMLINSGLTVVCASGNSGQNNLKSPGISPDVISVGAVDDNNNITEFSSFGIYQGVPRPDLYAHGVKLKGLSAGGTYQTMSGTSVSAPYVAGACCLLHQKYKNLNPWQTKRLLIDACYTKNGVKIFSLD